MKEYGGYIQLDTYRGQEYYPNLLSFNSGRGALRFLIRIRNIKKLYLPGFCCSTVWEACEAERISWEFYQVDDGFRPVFDKELENGEWLYIVNHYGVFASCEMEAMIRQFGQVIVDHTHAFFRPPLAGADTLYSCRKFFGVPDGAYLSLGLKDDQEYAGRMKRFSESAWQQYSLLPMDQSFDRMHFLLGRYEAPASKFYQEYAENNERFTSEPVKQMSSLTHNLLRAIDYEEANARRTRNFSFLSRQLSHMNRLFLPMIPGAFAYPLWLKEGLGKGPEIRRELIRHKVYIPCLWPEVEKQCPKDSADCQMAENILPLPVDQRYQEADMREILDRLLSLI
ncbi:MAG: hypothetical protein HFG49_00300 [Lachnospiraceae bacterium]|jgi:hypothetical protein|nr:hypothetical protein [Lachnospiraceae bacterium]